MPSWCPRRPSAWSTFVTGAVVAAPILVLAAACDDAPSASSSSGSGISVTDRRDVPAFTSVELAGANTVVIRVGAPTSVAVTGDDDLVDRVTTMVDAGHLVIDDTGSFTTTAPMRVEVSTPSLDDVELSGAGTVTVDGVEADEFTAELAGDGTLAASGTVQRLTAVLGGTGTLDLSDVVATDGTAQLHGAGTLRVTATSTLEATLSGTGTILYGGDPTVTVHDTGTGTVTPE